MNVMIAKLHKVVSGFWSYLREVSGENDYARYKSRVETEGGRPLTPREFYFERQRHKYARPNRCC